MRRFFTIGSLILIFQTIFYHTGFSQDWLWALQISSSEAAAPEAIKIDNAENIFIFSELKATTTIGGITINAHSEKDFLILKLNKYGEILWYKEIGNVSIDDPKDMYLDANGNIYITGSFLGSLTFDDITITSTDEKDAFLAKYNSNGNIVWAKNMGNSLGDQKGRVITSDGVSLFVLGFYYDEIHLNRSLDTTFSGNGKKNFFLSKYDLNGNLINARKIYSSNNNILLSGLIYLNNSLFISGYFTDTLIYDNDTLLSVNHSKDFAFMKIDLNGNLIWANSYGSNENDEIWDMATDNQYLYLTGYFKNAINVDSYTLTSNGDKDIFVGKFDQNGNTLWALSTGSNDDDRALGIVFKNNKLSVTGLFSNSLNWNNTIVANANSEPFIGYVSTDGNFLNAVPVTVLEAGTSRGNKIEEDSNNHSFLIGKFNSSAIAFNSNISLNNTNSGNYDGFIAKYGCFDGITLDVTDAGCSGHNDGQITATPNEGYGPFSYNWSNGKTTQTISNLNHGDYTVTVSDNSGCSAIATASIVYHPPLGVSTQITQEILCNGDSTGEIVATASDGFPPYSYSWSNGDTTTTISNLPSGDYTITVTDQCGNTAVEAVTVTEPDSLDINLTGNIYHMGSNCIAKITAHISGGTSPYSYEWFDMNGNSLGTNSSLWVWADDYYIIVVTDANGCVAGWWFYVPGCNKSMDVNDSPELNTTTQYPETDIALNYGSQPNNNNASKVSQNRGTASNENTKNQIYDIDLAAGLKSLGIGPEINAFPNPADETLNISLKFPYDANAQIILLNSTGQTVKIVGWSQTFSYEKNVDVNNLSNGIYFLMVKTDFGIFKKNISIVH